MMDSVILFRNSHNGRVGFVSDDVDGEIAVFPDRDAAIDAAMRIPCCQAFPYQVIELDEL